MKLKASDTLHISSIRSERIVAGDTFEINAEDGKSLIDRGLATEVTANPKPGPKRKGRK